jgi:hypothetical protein
VSSVKRQDSPLRFPKGQAQRTFRKKSDLQVPRLWRCGKMDSQGGNKRAFEAVAEFQLPGFLRHGKLFRASAITSKTGPIYGAWECLRQLRDTHMYTNTSASPVHRVGTRTRFDTK